MGQALSVVVAIGVPLGLGTAVSLAIKDDVKTWYQGLNKPSWAPPDWAFGPIWTCLYTAMGYASYLVWNQAGNQTFPLYLYGIQLVLNLAWSPIFFRKKDIGFALLDITALLGVLGATIVEFNKVSPTAAYLMLPYFAFSAFATALTADVWKRNPKARGADSEKARKQAQNLANQAESVISGYSGEVKNKASDLGNKVKDAAGSLSDKVQKKEKDVENESGDTADKLQDAADNAEKDAKKATDKAASKVQGAAKGVQGASS